MHGEHAVPCLCVLVQLPPLLELVCFVSGSLGRIQQAAVFTWPVHECLPGALALLTGRHITIQAVAMSSFELY